MGGLNTYDISFNMTQLFSAKIHAGERTEHSKMRYFFRKMLFFEIFWTFKFDQKFEPKSRNCETQMIPNIKISSKTVELVLQSSLS